MSLCNPGIPDGPAAILRFPVPNPSRSLPLATLRGEADSSALSHTTADIATHMPSILNGAVVSPSLPIRLHSTKCGPAATPKSIIVSLRVSLIAKAKRSGHVRRCRISYIGCSRQLDGSGKVVVYPTGSLAECLVFWVSGCQLKFRAIEMTYCR